MHIPWLEKDYKYIKFYWKAYHAQHDATEKENYLSAIYDAEARRDYYTGSLKQISNAIQLDQKPNFEIKEAQADIYKITISFEPISMNHTV